MEALDLRDAVMVGHSTGGGEMARYIGLHGTGRVAKVMLVRAVPPVMVSTAQWPGGLDTSVFDGIRKGVSENRSTLFLDLALPFFGMNRPGTAVNEGLRQSFWSQGMMGSVVGQYACIHVPQGTTVGHHGLGVLHWTAGLAGQDPVVTGMDAAEIEDGRIARLWVLLEPPS